LKEAVTQGKRTKHDGEENGATAQGAKETPLQQHRSQSQKRSKCQIATRATAARADASEFIQNFWSQT